MRERRHLILAAAVVALIAALAILAPVLPLQDPLRLDVAHRLSPPDVGNLLGQDEVGRDVFSRLIWGARASLGVAAAASLIACVLGIALGLAGGLLGGVAELFAVRSMDIILCFPPLLLALLVVTLLGPGAATLIPLLAMVYLPGFVRVTYAGVLSVRSQDYVEAVRALGAGWGRVMLRTVLPNIAGPVLVQLSLAVANAIVLESGLSFLGLGVVPPEPSWGLMIAAARSTMIQAPLLLLWPCLALTGTILAMNALCDALRDWTDPRPDTGAKGGLARNFAQALGFTPRAVTPAAPDAVLDVRGMTVVIDTPAGPIHPVRDVSLHVAAGETLAVVGESGSGKTMAGLAVMGLLPPAARVEAGSAFVDGQDVMAMAEPALRKLRGGKVAMIFQDPLSSLNPVYRVGDQIAEGVRAHQPVSESAAQQRAVALLRRVGVPDPEKRARAFPHELSGGMRQRAMIAMAVANHPRLLIADEPTTALDVTIQAQVLDLLADLRRQEGMALLFITHSLPVVAEFADRVVVMYAGQVVEEGTVAQIFESPRHPYTAALLASAPAEDGTPPEPIPGSVPLPHHLPPGCAFAPRCPHQIPACDAAVPPLLPAGEGRTSRCIRWKELSLPPPSRGRAGVGVQAPSLPTREPPPSLPLEGGGEARA